MNQNFITQLKVVSKKAVSHENDLCLEVSKKPDRICYFKQFCLLLF
jgi:hypothetical protein